MSTEKKIISVVEGETYFLCMCNQSAAYPFCDGAHKGSGVRSLLYTAPRSMSITLENGSVIEEISPAQDE